MHLKRCRICKSKELEKVFTLGKQPLANNLLANPGKAPEYPLELLQCTHCSFIQLSYVVPKEKMYDTYFYIPSVSKTQMTYFDTLSQRLIADCGLKKRSLVVDIGSNDGSLLWYFKKHGMRVLGIDPAENIKPKVQTMVEYFNPQTAFQAVWEKGKAKLATATNSFAHIHDLESYIHALDLLLDKDGIFFAQFPDVRNLLAENQFDTIYHEHLSYFSYESLHHLFSTSPFELYRIDSTPLHGGSMQIYARRRKPLLDQFVINANMIQKDLVEYCKKQKKAGKRIVGFAAAAKGITLLNACGLDNKTIDYIADGTSYKQGKFTPGGNIPVVSEEYLLDHKPDIVIILAWNFKDEIINKLKGRGYTFVVPIPKVEVIR